ncbi:MAG: VOC family protein [Candidatus Methanomethylophilaceae archaeon]|nr:VOC family protein [Candidatus Methanomethylophilaceae archaeon]NCA73368.1 glyoxalase [Gammaproteobacteria bacterium]MDD3351019.1 VOC family protein [Candidatus Methanomethylophilaceae archaeon]MDD3986379.1 VOC family protein [Candidatus Methanomethylophilaceae archaeon]MDD4708818.1 VOC family protein [Candidatus Methanomethylophilaceae archaeon]
MPLGDPHGGDFEYTDEGLPKNITAVRIPTRDLDDSIGFYSDLLGMEVLTRKDTHAVLRREDAVILLIVSSSTGIDTGFYIGVDDPYALHRRLIDEGVVFMMDPEMGPIGVYTSFRDTDGNVIRAVDKHAVGSFF